MDTTFIKNLDDAQAKTLALALAGDNEAIRALEDALYIRALDNQWSGDFNHAVRFVFGGDPLYNDDTFVTTGAARLVSLDDDDGLDEVGFLVLCESMADEPF